MKFTPDGGKVGIEAQKTSNGEILVCVWDTGIGIEPQDSLKVFSEFEQISSDYSRQYAGTGLGLPLSKKFVELHGGKMWFESDGKDKGTRFYFSLPPAKHNERSR
jgi:signal transduction histidine kinase